MQIKVLHIGHSAKWRGGENQARLLIEQAVLQQPSCEHFLAYPKGAVIFDRLDSVVKGKLSLASRKAFDIRSILALIKFSKAHGINILHAHSATAHTLALVAKRFLPNTKLIVHRRVDNPIKPRRSTRSKYLSNHVDKFICVSQAISDILHDYGVDKDKIELIYDSIDGAVYRDQDKANSKAALMRGFAWNKNTPLLGFISAVDSQKNPELFVEIVKGVLDRGIQINAVMAGSGKLMDTVTDLVNSHGLSENLKLLGFVEGVNDLFSALDIFILPSRNEGLGTVMLEAIAANTVVVASKVGGIGEVIVDNQTGRLIEAGNLEAYINAVIELIDQPQQRQALANNAQQHVAGKFDLSSMVSETLAVYQQVLERR